MTVADRNPSVVVTSDETLPEIVDRLRGAANGGRTVDLVVPIDSALLLTASEFRTLKDAIDEERLSVVMRTADPLRLRLGDRLGIRVQAIPRPVTSPKAIDSPFMPPPIANVPTPLVEDEGASGDLGIAGTRPDPGSNWPFLDLPAEGELSELADVDEEAEPFLASGPANPPRRWLPAALLLALLVGGAFLAIRFVVPGATIRITPKSAPVAASLLFDVTADGQPLDGAAAFAIAPGTQSLELVWEGSAPASGVRTEPDGTAGGPIELRNASAEPLNVDAETVVVTESGVEFAFVETVTVPAADAATGEPGVGAGRVRAVAPGIGGNVATGEIGGQLPNGVYYSNRMEPTGGGTDKEFAVVAQADLDALSAQAREAARGLAQDALAEDDANGAQLVTTVTIKDQQDTFDRQVAEDAESVALRSTMTVEVTSFDEAAAETEYQAALERMLGEAAPEGYEIQPTNLSIVAPVETLDDERGTRFQVDAEANAVAVLDDTERDALVKALAGASADEAAKILGGAPEIAEFTVDYAPVWLPEQMPNNTGRITFEHAP